MRGLAAVMVLVFHLGLIFRSDPGDVIWSNVTALIGCLAYGHAWVIFFLVHSGFVLAKSLQVRGPAASVWAFYVRRLLRLWPMIAFSSVTLSAYVAAGFAPDPDPSLSPFFQKILSPVGQDVRLLDNILLISVGLNGFFWSLQVEALCSLAMPAFMGLCRVAMPACLIVLGLYGLVFGPAIGREIIDPHISPVTSIAIAYMLSFFLGVVLAHSANAAAKVVDMIGGTLSFVIGLVVLVAAHTVFNDERPEVCVQALGAAMIVFSAYYKDGPIQRLLTAPIARFYGEISYSFYVNSLLTLHAATLLCRHLIDPLQHGIIATLVTFAIAMVLNTALSTLTNRLLERPAIAFGRWLTSRRVAIATAGPAIP
jgi:peptidoglycan/LPS O-acetylase OafA/YrhL